MTDVLIKVGTAVTRVYGLPGLRTSDLYANAPEPAPQDWNGIRSTSANLTYLDEVLPGSRWEDPQNRLMEARAMRLVEELRRNVQPGEYEAAFPFKMVPLPFQMTTFAAARHMTNIALAPVAMGTGKTKMTLDVAADKFLRDEIDCMLVIAPNGVHRQWVEAAIPQHLVASVKRAAAVWKPTRKTPPRILFDPGLIPANRACGTSFRVLRVLTFNVESFSSESGKAFKAALQFLASGRCMLVVDESSRIKTPRAARTKAILKLRDKAAVRAILSGTPLTRGIEDLYSQYNFLDPSIIGMSNYMAFRARYCVTVPAYRGAAFGAVKIVGYKNVEELVRKIAPVSFVIPKDVLGLPEKRYEVVPVPLAEEQARVYQMLEQQLIEDLHARRITNPANAAVRLMRLQQVLSGRVYTQSDDEDEPPIVRTVQSNRISTLIEVLEQYDGQAVIWARFAQDIKDIREALGDNAVTYDGSTSQADRETALTRFKSGDAAYFVGNPAAAGTGIDGLQCASMAVYYSNSFNSEQRWQSEDRIHRIGQKESTLYVDLGAPDTVDALIRKNLRAKGDLARSITENPNMLMQRED